MPTPGASTKLNTVSGISQILQITSAEFDILANKVLPANIFVKLPDGQISLTDGVKSISQLNPLIDDISGGIQEISTGSTNGTISVDGTDVSVKGLGSAAYSEASAYAASGHTHTTTLASDSGTASITLAHGSTYKLSAGGTEVTFKMPTDNNTTYSSKAAASGGTDVSLVTTGEKYTWNNKLDKTTYNYNKELAIGSSGYVLIGKFPCYDSNITIHINSTTSTTYHATAVLATQNINGSAGGSINWICYDPLNNVTDSLFAKYVSGSNVIEIYFKPAAWSKNLVQVQCVALTSAPTNILEKVNSIPAEATRKPTNAYGSSPKFTDTTYSSKAAANGGTDVSLVTTGEKYTWNNKSTLALGTSATTAAKGNHTHSSLTNPTNIEFTGVGSSAGHGGYIDFHWNGSTADYTSRIIENASGQLNVTGSLVVAGTLKGAAVQSTSDIRKKSNIVAIDDVDLHSIKAYEYNLEDNKRRSTGLIAQEVEKILPTAVEADENGFLSLDYNAIVAVLVNKINKLETRIHELENK